MPQKSKTKPKKTDIRSNRVQEAREECGLTKKELADAIKVSGKTIDRLEIGNIHVKIVYKHRVANELSKHKEKFVFAYLFPNG